MSNSSTPGVQDDNSAPTAIVTGASAGIGEAFARRLAASGHNLVLVARRHDRISRLADSLSLEYGITAWPEALDLSEPGAPSALFNRTQAMGLEIDLLVNNAGALLPGRLLDNSWNEHVANLRLMALAPCELMYLYLRPMVQRHRGAILNIASMSVAWPATPGDTFYAPSKSFLLKATRSVAREYRGSGVTIAALSPGVTRTELLTDPHAAPRVRRIPTPLVASPRQVAAAGVELLHRQRVHGYVGITNSLLSWSIEHLLPSHIVTELLAKWMLPPDTRAAAETGEG